MMTMLLLAIFFAIIGLIISRRTQTTNKIIVALLSAVWGLATGLIIALTIGNSTMKITERISNDGNLKIIEYQANEPWGISKYGCNRVFVKFNNEWIELKGYLYNKKEKR